MVKKKCLTTNKRKANLYFNGSELLGQRSMPNFASMTQDNPWVGLKAPQGIGNLKSPLDFNGKMSVFGSKAGGAISGAASIFGAAKANAQIGDTSQYDNALNEAEAYQVGANSNDDLMNEWSEYQPLEHISWKDVKGMSGGQRALNTIGATGSGAMAGMSVAGPVGAIGGALAGLTGGIIGSIRARRKAKKYARNYNRNVDALNERNLYALEDRAENIDTMNDLNIMGEYLAYGGGLSRAKNYGSSKKPYPSVSKEDFAGGGRSYPIPTRADAIDALRLAGLHGRSDVKSKVYAKYPSLRKHDLGGPLFTNGANWSNGLIIIGNGNTHENNPYEGVQIGVDNQGVPNLVEEGEVVWNDYVFSNRLKPNEEVKKKYKLKGNTFADAVKYLQKESEERPNDPISKRGLDSMLAKLANEQELIRQAKEGLEGVNYAACGGKLNKFDDGSWLYREFKPGEVPTEEEVMQLGKKYIPKSNLSLHDASIQAARDLSMTPNNKYFKGYVPKNKSTLANIARASALVGPMVGLGMSLKKPDYTNVNDIASLAENVRDIEFNPIGNYMSFVPFDEQLPSIQAEANAAASRRVLGNNPLGKAAVLASDYNLINNLGALHRQAKEYNLTQRQKVEEFNRGTNMYNSEGLMKAAMANMEAQKLRNSYLMSAAGMKEEIDQGRRQSIIGNVDNLFSNLGSIGKEQFAMDMIKNNPALLYDWLGNYKGNKSSNGGYLTIKRKRG